MGVRNERDVDAALESQGAVVGMPQVRIAVGMPSQDEGSQRCTMMSMSDVMGRRRSRALLAAVFVTGACVLVLEVVATRMLAPYFGNTIFAFSSVIGVTLAALSAGYAAGGRFADARPLGVFFSAIILLSGAAILWTKLLSVTLLPAFAYRFPLTTGPLVFSLLLFAIPCALLGTLSPYAIRLLRDLERADRVGSLSGQVFAVSTIGSIVGTFAAGFVLIPRLGVQSILLILGATLLATGAIGMIMCRRQHRWALPLLACVVAVSVLFGLLSIPERNPSLLHVEEGLYQTIMVYDAPYRGRETRFLRQDLNASSAIDRATGEPAFDYAKYYAFATALRPKMESALVIGAGAFTIPQALTEHSRAMVDVVEIEPGLQRIAREFFGVEETPRIRTTVADGRRFLRDRDGAYDLIVSDAYQNLHSIPPHLATREFFALTRRSLTDDGLLLVNFTARLGRDRPSLLWSAVRTFRSVFPESAFFAVNSLTSPEVQNVIFLGCARAECADPCARILAVIPTAFFREACSRQIAVDDAGLAEYALLTDDYAPLEALAAVR